MLTDDYLSTLNYQQRLDLLSNQDFCDASTLQGLNPADVLDLASFTRADRCSQPVVMTKLDVHSKEEVEVAFPCGTSDANRCQSCADYLQKLRRRQVLEGLTVEGTQSALFTLTAPSFGAVHRASFTVKDNQALKRVMPHKRAVMKERMMRKNGKCGCGKWHEYTDDVVGTPRGAYDYIGEVIWSHNLPRLLKSTVRRVRYMAKKCQIDPDDVRFFSVYERQKRGSLHIHMLITVKDNPVGFSRLMSQIKTSWVSPTSRLEQPLVEYLKGDIVQQRLDRTGVKSAKDVRSSIPKAKWKKGEEVEATEFGSVFDLQILTGTSSGFEAITTSRQASEYISKYLTKTQSAFSCSNLKKLPKSVVRHYKNLRMTAVALLADRVLYELKLEDVRKQISELCSDENRSAESKKQDMRRLKKLLWRIKFRGITGTQLPPNVSSRLVEASLTGSFLNDLQMLTGTNRRLSMRGLKIRLNKLANNAGFSGSLTSISRWRSTLHTLKQRVRDWAINTFGGVDKGSLIWKLNPEGMTAERKRRFRVK